MSLVSSTAFQINPAIQPRAFAVMGCLAREDVDDDLLYQVLVALRSGLTRYQQDGDAEMLTSIVTSLTKMMDNLPTNSRYLLQLFWLAMALVRGGSGFIFNCSAGLLEAVLRVISNSGDFKEGKLSQVLLAGRAPVEEAASAIDSLYGIRFENDSFHFAVAVTLMKGLQDPTTKPTTMKTIAAFLEITTSNHPVIGHRATPPYLPVVAARATNVDEMKEIFWTANLPFDAENNDRDETFDNSLSLVYNMKDKDLFLMSAMAAIDFNTCEEQVQQHALVFFTRVARNRPDIIVLL